MFLPRATRASAGEVERLISYILVRYHDPARFGWPNAHRAVSSLAEQVETLQPLANTLGAFVDQLEGHLRFEEEVLFPYFIQLESWELGVGTRPRVTFGDLRALVSVLVDEHREEERLLQRIRESTNGYSASMAELGPIYDVLRALDSDQSGHAFVEDTVLLPRMLRLEERLLEN